MGSCILEGALRALVFPTADALAMDLAAACTYPLAGRVHSSVEVLLAVKVAILKLAAHQHPATVSEQTYPAPELKTEFRLWLLLGEGLSASWNPKLLQKALQWRNAIATILPLPRNHGKTLNFLVLNSKPCAVNTSRFSFAVCFVRRSDGLGYWW